MTSKRKNTCLEFSSSQVMALGRLDLPNEINLSLKESLKTVFLSSVTT